MEDCVICCTPIGNMHIFGKCSHRAVCVKCSLKLREVFKDKKCVLCKEMLDEVVVTAVSDSKFHDLNVSKMKVDRQTGIRLDSNISSQVLDVLKFRCPICVSSSDENARPFRTVRALKAHAARDHEGKMFCDLCLQNRKVFPHEQRLYTYDELKIHMKRGDPPRDGSGALAPHPRCKFCHRKQFFDEECLAKHMREAHFQCHVCQRENRNEYFRNYVSLRKHFERDHFVCEHAACKDQKFVVFGSRLEYNAHLVSVHGEKSARRLSPSMFFAASSSSNNRRSGRNAIMMTNNNTASDITSLQAERQRVRGRDIMLRIRRAFEQMDRKNAAHHVDTFRNLTSTFKTNQINSQTYIQLCYDLFKNDTQLKSLFDEFVSLIPDRVKANEIKRSMNLFRVAETSRRRLENEFPELRKKEEKKVVKTIDDVVDPPRRGDVKRGEKKKKLETDWNNLSHVRNCPRRLLVSTRRALIELSKKKRHHYHGRRQDRVIEKQGPLPEWTFKVIETFSGSKRREVDCTEFVPPLISGFSSDAKSDWSTLLDLYAKIHNDEGIWESSSSSNVSDLNAEEKKLTHLSKWIRGSLQNMSESDRTVLKYFIQATVQALKKNPDDDLSSSCNTSSASVVPPGFPVKRGDERKSNNSTSSTNGGKKKKKKKKKGRVLDFSRKQQW